MKHVITLSLLALTSTTALAYSPDTYMKDNAKMFHEQFITYNRVIKIPRIMYTITDKDGVPLSNMGVDRYMSYRNLLGKRPDIGHIPEEGEFLTDEHGQIAYEAFSHVLIMNKWPVIRLNIRTFYPIHQCQASFSGHVCTTTSKDDEGMQVECRLDWSLADFQKDGCQGL